MVFPIEAMSKARAEAFNEGNAADIALHFTDDAILMTLGQAASQGDKGDIYLLKAIINPHLVQDLNPVLMVFD